MVELIDNAQPECSRVAQFPVGGINAETAYVIQTVTPTVNMGVPSYRLLKMKIERGQVVSIEAGVENLRETVLQEIEDHILRDA
jgi:hypothetical protein